MSSVRNPEPTTEITPTSNPTCESQWDSTLTDVADDIVDDNEVYLLFSAYNSVSEFS